MKRTFNKARMFRYIEYAVLAGIIGLAAEIEIRCNKNPEKPSGIETKVFQEYKESNADANEPKEPDVTSVTNRASAEPNGLEVKASEANKPKEVNKPNKADEIKDVNNLRKEVKLSYPNPKYKKDDNFASGSNEMTFARGVYGEAKGELNNQDYVYGFVQTVKNRGNIRNKSVKEIFLENRPKKVKDKNGREKVIRVWQYSCFSPWDVNYKKLKDPIKFSGENIWRECYDKAVAMLNNKFEPVNETQERLKRATNYWVDIVEPPIWAYVDNNRKKGLREPLAVVPVRDGKNKAYFYSFEHP